MSKPFTIEDAKSLQAAFGDNTNVCEAYTAQEVVDSVNADNYQGNVKYWCEIALRANRVQNGFNWNDMRSDERNEADKAANDAWQSALKLTVENWLSKWLGEPVTLKLSSF